MKQEKKKHRQDYSWWKLRTSRDKGKTKILWRGSWRYWLKTVRRINVFADTDLKPGIPILVDANQCIPDGKSRLKLALTYRKLMKQYEGKELFTPEQVAEIERVLHGGSLVLRPE